VTWQCLGQNGGTTDNCSRPREACPINGVCGGSANTCAAGTPTGDNGETACGTTRTWSCNGSGGGTNAPCSLDNPLCPYDPCTDPDLYPVSAAYFAQISTVPCTPGTWAYLDVCTCGNTIAQYAQCHSSGNYWNHYTGTIVPMCW
jgi:hypothetical protein